MALSLEERVLIVEDEQVQALNLQATLLDSGFYVIGSTDRGDEAVQICADLEPTLVLMNAGLVGKMKGPEAAHQIQRRFKIPVVLLASCNDSACVEAACENWPFGYLSRACKVSEMVSTLRSAVQQGRELRDSTSASRSAIVMNNARYLQVSTQARYQLFSGSLSTRSAQVRLTPKEQKFLDLLGRNQGRVVPFERIFSEVWDNRIDGFQPLRILVHRLRRKLGQGDGIENIFEMGYRLNLLSQCE